MIDAHAHLLNEKYDGNAVISSMQDDKLEYIIQKSVELGVSKIVPVLTRRCVSRPDEKEFTKKKLPRLNKIAEGAAKQSGRGIIPEVTPMVSLKEALEMMKQLDKNILL